MLASLRVLGGARGFRSALSVRQLHGLGEPKFDPSRSVEVTNVSWLEGSNFAGSDEDGKVVTLSVSAGFLWFQLTWMWSA